jgi:hypothetical protein
MAMSVPGLSEYIYEHGIFQKLSHGMKRMLAVANPKASDAMWDNDFRKAIVELRKYGLVEQYVKTSNRAPKTRACYMGGARLSGSFSNPGADWKYVKAVRSK